MKVTSLPTSIANARSSKPAAPLPPFDYVPLTRVVFEAGGVARLGELTRELGGNRVLLVTDPGLEKVGHPRRALAALQEAGLKAFIFDSIEENPTTRHVELGVEAARRHNVDFLVGLGGGSPMDCAKAINFLLTNGGTMSDYKGFGKATRPMLPSIGIPTTSGTGSEAQSYALIADEKTHLKMACGDRKAAFRVTILDPELTVSAPRGVTAITAIDALSHAVESYVSTRGNMLSRLFAREAWRLLETNYDTVLRHPDDIEARGAMQLGAHFAGMAIENSMLGCAHSCANPLTAHYGLTHGIAVGLMLPHVIRFNSSAVGAQYADLAHEVGLINGDGSAAGEVLALRTTEFLRAANLPTRLSDCGVSPGIFPILAEEASQQWTAKFNPRSVADTDLLHLYEMAY